MTKNITLKRTKLDQTGFAAIVIAVVLVTVLSLVTIGFAELVRHEQNNSLNRQLSNAAYYAAEAGINDASKALAQGYTTPKTTCDPLPAGTTGGGSYLTNNVVSTDSHGGSSYTCLLIYEAPLDIQFSSVGSQDDNAKSFVINAVDPSDNVTPTPVTSFTISWQDQAGRQTFAPAAWSSHPFQTASNWTNGGNQVTGVLKLQLVPLGGGLNRANLTNAAYDAFLYPTAGGSTVTSSYSSGTGSNAGIIIDGNCSAGQVRYCKANIDVSSLNQSQFLMRLVSLYDNSAVTIIANGSGGTQLRVAGVQSLIDSTGKSAGVLRRVQVRVPDQNSTLPEYGIESLTGICKQLTVYPNYASSGCDNAAQ